MDDAYLDIYVREVGTQCALAGTALVLLGQTPEDSPLTGPQPWVALTSFLASCAMLSKLLWPQPPARKHDGSALSDAEEELRNWSVARGRTLRSVLGVPKSSPLAAVRTVRNGFEHIDERLDRFILGRPSRIIDMYVGTRESLGAENKDVDIVRHFDPDTGVISVLGENVSVFDLKPALDQLYEASMVWTLEYAGPTETGG